MIQKLLPSTKLIDSQNYNILLNTVVPHSAATAPLPSPIQHKHDQSCVTKSCWIVNISDITRICLHHHIQKIYNMLTKAIEGYGTFYYNKHVNPLPQETVHKILRLYHNRIKCCCIEVGLTVEEEKEWDSKGAKVDVVGLSKSGKESEEHDLDEVIFYLNVEVDKDNYGDYDVDNIGLSFEELKQRHIQQALQQCQDRNGPLAKAMRDMIESPPPPFESSDNGETTNNVMDNTSKIAK